MDITNKKTNYMAAGLAPSHRSLSLVHPNGEASEQKSKGQQSAPKVCQLFVKRLECLADSLEMTIARLSDP